MSPVLLIFLLSISFNDAAKILAMFPVPSISHQVAFRPLTQELAKRGHEVTVITPDPAFPKGEAPANLTEIDVHFTYEKARRLYEVTSAGNGNLITGMQFAFNMLVEAFEDEIKVDEVQRLIKEEKFDLILVEACTRSALVLSHIFKAPLIAVSSFGTMNFNVETIGASWHPMLYPDSLGKRIYNLSIPEKLVELWDFYKMNYDILGEIEKKEDKMLQRLFGPDTPPLSELKNNVEMLFLNIHPIWEGNRAVPPSVVYMGGVHQKPKKELPADLKTFLDSSKNGVIYISFGTNVQPSLLPPEKVQILVKAFSELPYDVLWKWDKDELPGRTSNIKISKWLPQSDLLRHPKIKVFVTQGGLQSTDEAITAGVPLIGFPMLGDQWYNTEKYEHHKIGVKLELETFTGEEFKNTINDVIGDESYRKNIEKLRTLMYDHPMTPLERAVWWTEHVLRHGGARHLRSPAANMSWTQFLELELVFTVLSVALGFVLLVSLLLYYSYKHFILSSKLKKLKDN
ncbi:UDP-glucosyltransferase 2-like [Helicoverpa armigera]|uniref:UDP-glucosyltransferase 2-like n=1 Tax=Helicoverpa armigera TaxID=29058 RepID=UPI003083C32F